LRKMMEHVSIWSTLFFFLKFFFLTFNKKKIKKTRQVLSRFLKSGERTFVVSLFF